ncbi:aKG-HExxH-type peptide beta-hydroxylase [Streptomyces eurythermus]|uniref:aKG-HExxH-type peptide beta-hydroxylase n=1 Tax=Streptomyces eurythermus TaxID=42237 RepID=UPI0033EF06C6
MPHRRHPRCGHTGAGDEGEGALLPAPGRRRLGALGLATALAAVTPRPRSPIGTVVALSSSDAFGGAEMSAPAEAVDLAVGLVHEFRHMKLDAVLDCVDLYTEADGEPEHARYYAPWRDDPRPLPGYLHGVFAYFGVVDLWRRLRRDRDPAVRRRARFEFAHWRVQTGDAYTLLCASSRLIAAGREFTAMMAESAAHWTGQESVPDDLALLAREAVIAHRLGWRAHYLRPSAGQITELTEAWLSGAAGPPRRHVDTVFREVRPAPGLTEYGDRLRRAACDPGGISWSTLHPVDHARLSGETGTACRLAVDRLPREWEQPWPWIRLGLALLRQSPEAATEDGDRVAAGTGDHPPPGGRQGALRAGHRGHRQSAGPRPAGCPDRGSGPRR